MLLWSSASAALGEQVAITWRWVSALVPPEAAPALWETARPVSVPGVLASRDRAHAWQKAVYGQPLNGTLIGRFVLDEAAAGQPGWLDVGPAAAAATIWLDARQLLSIGRPASSRAAEIPRILPQGLEVAGLPSGTHWLVMSLSGHHFKEVALWGPVSLTMTSPGATRLLAHWAPSFVLFGGLGLSVCYQFGLALRAPRRRVRKILIWLSLFSAAVLLRMLTARQLPELLWATQPPSLARYSVWMSLEFGSYYFGVLAWSQILLCLLKGTAGYWRPVLWGTSVAAAVASLMAWLTPPYVYTLFGSPMQALVALLLFISVQAAYRLTRQRPDLSGLWRVALLALLVPAVHDIALTQFWVVGRPWMEWGVLIVAFCTAWISVRLMTAQPVSGALNDEQAVAASAGTSPAKQGALPPEAGMLSSASPSQTDSARLRSANRPEADRERAKRARLVALLCRSLALWEVHTGRSKAALAEASGAWRVYLDGSTAKTRTLDKYMKVETLPARPRWRQVIRTAGYVQRHCALSAEEALGLATLIAEVEQDWSGAPVAAVKAITVAE